MSCSEWDPVCAWQSGEFLDCHMLVSDSPVLSCFEHKQLPGMPLHNQRVVNRGMSSIDMAEMSPPLTSISGTVDISNTISPIICQFSKQSCWSCWPLTSKQRRVSAPLSSRGAYGSVFGDLSMLRTLVGQGHPLLLARRSK